MVSSARCHPDDLTRRLNAWADIQNAEGHFKLAEIGKQDDKVLIRPIAGTVVLFDSRKFFHEVMPARTERRSFTGWFKVRALR